MGFNCCNIPHSFCYEQAGTSVIPSIPSGFRNVVWDITPSGTPYTCSNIAGQSCLPTTPNTRILTKENVRCNCVNYYEGSFGTYVGSGIHTILNYVEDTNYYYIERLENTHAQNYYISLPLIENAGFSNINVPVTTQYSLKHSIGGTVSQYYNFDNLCYNSGSYVLNITSEAYQTGLLFNNDFNIPRCGTKFGWETTYPLTSGVCYDVGGGVTTGRIGVRDSIYTHSAFYTGFGLNNGMNSGCGYALPDIYPIPQCSSIPAKSFLIDINNSISLTGCLNFDYNFYQVPLTSRNFDGTYNLVPAYNRRDESLGTYGTAYVYINPNESSWSFGLALHNSGITVNAYFVASGFFLPFVKLFKQFISYESNSNCNWNTKNIPASPGLASACNDITCDLTTLF